MHRTLHIVTLAVAAVALALPATAQTSGEATGADAPPAPLKPYLAPLHLQDADLQQIRAALAGTQTKLAYQLTTTEALKSFTPQVGVKIPPHLPALAMPSAVTQKLPQLANYTYAKFNGQLLIVNPTSQTIVSKFPEQAPPAG